ncbi:unnamed protein product [Didymodactylos carnosus]|uniref:Uncharacterized protein n=1 Tax=Didymodactylos carnosus TaxID=1234261 RepID=A0A813S7D0_9BILA|nr:unnamed protein product [Didymodactylos carnosus]CAF0792257.1 unnamed protein product [Didymodactylos carnosus]CAF3518533.1 unnamed protein product [Didymodactylos carnosus]CAF3576513.1 unnamed protein product [Didymodactylos carnosus]
MPLWSDTEEQPSSSDDILSKLFHPDDRRYETLLAEPTSNVLSYDQQLVEEQQRPRELQKRGRQCLWKVCSWALDKRALKVLY